MRLEKVDLGVGGAEASWEGLKRLRVLAVCACGACVVGLWKRRVSDRAFRVCVRGGSGGARRGGAYLPGRGDSMITKVVSPGRGLSIALRMG